MPLYEFRPRSLLVILSLGAVAFVPVRTFATDYFLGSDAANQGGVAVSDIAALNALVLRPGDRVAFQGGESFAGTITLDTEDSGTPTSPVTLTSYGTGRATINAGSGAGLKIYNAAGFAVSNLDLVGSGSSTNTCSGIDAGVYLPTSTKLDYLHFERMRISGFYTGIQIWAWYSTSTVAWPGFRDVALVNLEVSNNCSEGIKTWGTWRANSTGTQFSHSDFYIADCAVFNNQGDPVATWHTGSGIILSGVDRGTIEYCVAHDNGGLGPTTGGGPFGIWTWESHACTLQHNLVYNQKTSSSLDGGAFDLDGGSSDCTVQYNYSYNNEGPAIGLIQFHDASPLVRNVVRYNISENDGRKTAQGILYVGQYSGTYGINTADVYGNTFFISTNPKGGKPFAANVENQSLIANVRIRNNLFYATHTGTLIGGIKTNLSKALYQGNNYWGGAFDLPTFRSYGQEMLAGQPIGMRVDPKLKSPGMGGAITDPLKIETATAYQLLSGSPMIGAGLDLGTLFSLSVGACDFYGTALLSTALPIGAANAVTAAPSSIITPLVVDEFTGSGGLSNRVPDTAATAGQHWVIQSGSASIGNGDAIATNSLKAVIDGGSADGVLEATLVYGAIDTGLILRSTDGGNYLRAKLTTGSFNFAKIAAGVVTTLAAPKFNGVLGQTYLLKITLAGPVITVSIDGVVVATVSTTFNQGATLFGLYAANTGTRKWSRFSFTGTNGTTTSTDSVATVAPSNTSSTDVPAASSGVVLVADDFTGSGSLSNRIPDTIAPEGKMWTTLVGSFAVSSGSAVTSNSARAVIDVGASDGVLESTVLFGANDTGLVFRCVDAGNYLRVVLTTSGLTVRSYQNGVGAELMSVKRTFTIGQIYRLRAELTGPSIVIVIDDVIVGSLPTAINQTATRFGVFAANTGARQWMSFSFTAL